MVNYFTRQILLPEGWKTNVLLTINAAGDIDAMQADSKPTGATIIDGIVIPGMPNLHSHAFQRAMSGLSEYAVAGENNFWSWRRTMYRLANIVTAGQLQVIAAQLYVEMLKSGYTSVAEFHYLHHDHDGRAYANPGETSTRLMEAASETGIGMTLLPVLYMTANFDGTPAGAEQRRFTHDIDGYIALLESLLAKNTAQLNTGIAVHSLRAVPTDPLLVLLDYYSRHLADRPVHIHIAEQQKEVDDCIATHGTTPVHCLSDHTELHHNWCLVHATHITDEECKLLAERDCVIGLCPTTEANLGDGIFPLPAFLDAGGHFGIGSDSHVSVNPVEELRWLEYTQRLHLQKRNVSASEAEPHTAAMLWNTALHGGARAMGRNINGIRVGNRADLLVLDDNHPLLVGKSEAQILDSVVFAGNASLVKDVMVGGQWLVQDHQHAQENEIAHAFRKVMNELVAQL